MVGVLVGPIIWAAILLLVHLTILRLRWFVKVLKGNRMSQWAYLIAISWALPKLDKRFCHFMRANGKQWFSPRSDAFVIFPVPEDLGN
jgi:hypothetical protein